jgi:hypothetical protein
MGVLQDFSLRSVESAGRDRGRLFRTSLRLSGYTGKTHDGRAGKVKSARRLRRRHQFGVVTRTAPVFVFLPPTD